VSNIQNNIVRNFSWSNSGNANWTGIHVAGSGDVNIGTTSGNTIGDVSGTGSILVTGGATNSVYGINITSTGIVNCLNNNIGSITTANNNTSAGNFYGINKSGGATSAGTITINNNTIGSTSTPNSIFASSQSTATAQSVIGILNGGTEAITISSNTIANMTNGSANTDAPTPGEINGISSTNGTNTISGNIIHDLTSGNANNLATNNASVCGISLSAATIRNVTGNTIYNLSNSYTSFAGSVIGLYFSGITGGNNTISQNFIHSLSVSGSSTAASIYGIKIASGASTYSNNIITLGGDTPTTLYGIYETGAVDNNNNLYFNTVYIGGSPGSGVPNLSYALFSNTTTNTRNFRNNIFMNARSTAGGTNLHYAAWFDYSVNTGLTADNNDYWAPGVGGVLGYFGGNKTVLPIVAGQDLLSRAVNPGFASPGGTTATDYIPASTTLLAALSTGISTDYAGASRSLTMPSMGAFEITILSSVQVYKAAALQGNYSTLKEAFDLINSGVHTEALEIRINNSTNEIAPAVLNASGGTANYTSVLIYPTTAGIAITGNLASPLIDLDGADNVTIDGRINASGSEKSLIIINSSNSATAGTSTVRFINDAANNFVQYCILKGSSFDPLAGVLFFSSTTGTSGNDANTIGNNDITSAADANRPLNVIYSSGTAAKDNSGNIVSNNNIYNFLSRTTASSGIKLDANSNSWTISGNSFYETNSFAPTVSVAYNILEINNSSGTGFVISGNYIGGNAALCAGVWTKTNFRNNAFTAINLNVGTVAANSVQNNTIQNINWANLGAASWTGINVIAGDVNIGTTTGNIIGAASGTGSITVTAGGVANVYGINLSSTGTIDCQNNIISSITVANSIAANATNFYGINYTGIAGIANISNNTVGGESAGSINASSESTGNAQIVAGITNRGTGTTDINDNTVANLINGTTNPTEGTAGTINGIFSSNGTNIITNNIIHDLTIGNANTASDQTASVCGIALSGARPRTVTGNTIYNLSNTNTSFAGSVTGLHFAGSLTGNPIANNFIHSLSVDGGTSSASVYGIKIASGSSTYSNNIITLGGNTATTIYGIYETGAANNNIYVYFNTVYIGGSPGSGTNQSYALYSAVTTNVRNFRNNIFMNARSTAGGTDLHFALYIVSTGGTITCNYNDYWVTGVGGTLGYFGTIKSALPIVTGQDANSLSTDPRFTNAGSTVATGYQITTSPPPSLLVGINSTGIAIDYGYNPRGATLVAMGAWETVVNLNKWKGTAVSTDWSLPGNWTGNQVPAADANILFDDTPDNNLELDQNRSVTNITNGTSRQVVVNGFKLTIKGELIFTAGAQINATAANSTVEFAGLSAQTIPSGAFVNDQVYNLTINNGNNVTFNGTLNLLNNLTATSGLLDGSTNSPTLVYGGTSAQSILSGRFLNEKVYNLTIDNAAGVSLNTTFTVDNNLTINPVRSFTIDPPGRATVNTLINNGTLNLNSTPAGIFSLMMNTYSGSGISNAQIFMTGGGDPGVWNWHYVAVPIDGLPVSFFTAVNPYNLRAYDDLRVIDSDFNGWSWWDGYGGTPGIAAGGGFTTMSYGKGYLFWNGTDATVNLTGLTSLGTTLGTLPLQYSGTSDGLAIFGYNLLGNSLTCSLDWNNAGFTGPVGQTVYYTTGNKWASYLAGAGGTNGGTRYIPPLQGFFVKAEAAGASIDLSAARVHQSVQNRYKKSLATETETTGEIIYPKVKLELSGIATSDETIVWFNDAATTSYENAYDGYKLFSSEAAAGQLYSTLGGVNFVINGISLPTDSTIVPLAIKIPQSGSYSIQKQVMEELDNYYVYLIDKANGNLKVDLHKLNNYSFTSDAGTFTDRFVLKFASLTTAIETPAEINKKFNIYGTTGFINILPPDDFEGSPDGTVKIYNLTGRIVKQANGVGLFRGNLVQIPFTDKQGIYIVEIKSGLSSYKAKISVR
jgi:hypothetical protein